jgi:hypothetical protein
VPPRDRLAATADVIRHLLLVLLVITLCATALDLVLLEHYESSWMLVPLVMIGVSLIVIAWHIADRGPATVRVLRVTMLMLIVTGALGMALHYQANLEFQLDMDASQSGWELFKKVMHAKAPPAMAPGAMAQLGLLGWLYCFRHPALADRDRMSSSSSGA